MQKTTTRGATARRFVAFNLFTLLAGAPVFAQTGQLVRAEVPYEFTVASKTLPAGTYTFRVTDRGIQVQPANGEIIHAPIVTRLGGPTEFLQDGALVFDKTGSVRILSEVWMPGIDGVLLHSTPKDHKHEILLLTSGSRTPTSPEKRPTIRRAAGVMARMARARKERTSSSAPRFRGSARRRCKGSRTRN